YQEQYRTTMLKNLKRRAKQLGFALVEVTAQPVAAETTPCACRPQPPSFLQMTLFGYIRIVHD
ncbi:MAG: hypothetical protein ABSG53_29725, partial [Thermoguttaceae bacterium]